MDEIQELERLRKENRELKRQKRKAEFSKLIFIFISFLTVSVTIFSCYMIWLTKDTSALAYLIPAVFAEMAAATGFYFNKAKAENKIKLMASYGIKPEASDFETI